MVPYPYCLAVGNIVLAVIYTTVVVRTAIGSKYNFVFIIAGLGLFVALGGIACLW